MTQFLLKIAGHTARINSLFQSTRAHFARYLTEDPPEFSITVAPENLAFEQEEALQEAREEGFRPRIFPDPYLERAYIQRKFAEFLFYKDTLLLHGSVVAVDGEAFLFTARSGTGKSTHTRLWRQLFADRAVMVNDDKPFLQITDSQVIAWGSPWSGKHGLDTNTALPLKGICILERGTENRIRKASLAEAMPMLLKQSFSPPDSQRAFQALVALLADKLPLWHMECNKDPQAAQVAYQAMSAKQTG